MLTRILCSMWLSTKYMYHTPRMKYLFWVQSKVGLGLAYSDCRPTVLAIAWNWMSIISCIGQNDYYLKNVDLSSVITVHSSPIQNQFKIVLVVQFLVWNISTFIVLRMESLVEKMLSTDQGTHTVLLINIICA